MAHASSSSAAAPLTSTAAALLAATAPAPASPLPPVASAGQAQPARGWLRGTLWCIAVVQCVLGLGFLLVPEAMARALGLPPVPGWANWMFGMMAARFLAVGVGMVLAARDLLRHRAWLGAMIGIQAVDWLVTLRGLLAGEVTLAQVSTASFLPVVFIVLLALGWPRARTAPSA